MTTPRAAITPEAHAALTQLFTELGWTGQRGSAFSPGLNQLYQVAIAAGPELVAALTIAYECSLGGDWDELIKFTGPDYGPVPPDAEFE